MAKYKYVFHFTNGANAQSLTDIALDIPIEDSFIRINDGKKNLCINMRHITCIEENILHGEDD